MKLGILNALPGSYVLGGEFADTEKFVRLFGLIDPTIECLAYDATEGELPESPEVADAFLVTGSPAGVYDGDPWIASLEEFIRQGYAAQKKLVGICFGHQLLAQALGGRVEKSKEGWLLGRHSFELYRQPAWLTPPQASCSLYFINQDQVVTLPPDAERIGGSAACPNALFLVEERALGLQAHIEHTDAFMRAIISYLEPQLSRSRREEALRSLGRGQPDDRLVARWVLNFLKNGVTQ